LKRNCSGDLPLELTRWNQFKGQDATPALPRQAIQALLDLLVLALLSSFFVLQFFCIVVCCITAGVQDEDPKRDQNVITTHVKLQSPCAADKGKIHAGAQAGRCPVGLECVAGTSRILAWCVLSGR